MYREIVGSTAIRKSSKIRNILDEYILRVVNLNAPQDFINYTYFLSRINNFEIG